MVQSKVNEDINYSLFTYTGRGPIFTCSWISQCCLHQLHW